MAIFGQVKGREWERFSHKGYFLFCPVYLGNLESEAPTVTARNWIPEWWFTLNEWITGCCIYLLTLIDPEWEPVFALRITGPLVRESGRAHG